MFGKLMRIWAMYRTAKLLLALIPLAGIGGMLFAGFPDVRHSFAQAFDSATAKAETLQAGEVVVGFSPGNAESLVLRHIASAKKSLDMEAYEFTNKSIAEAVRLAYRRGVRVRVVADQAKISGKYNAATFLANNQVEVRASSPRYAIMHNKVIIVDGDVVQTGSFNYTSAAVKSNAENVVILKSKAAADVYTREFERLWAESKPIAAGY